MLKGNRVPGDKEVTAILESVKSRYKASIVYVMNNKGDTVASTTYAGGKTLLDNNYSFRPYFKKAIQGNCVIYNALGITTKLRGVYLSSPISQMKENGETKIIGVIVFKTNLEMIDSKLKQSKFPVALVSPQGIVFASNKNDWLFKSINPLT